MSLPTTKNVLNTQMATPQKTTITTVNIREDGWNTEKNCENDRLRNSRSTPRNRQASRDDINPCHTALTRNGLHMNERVAPTSFIV